MQLVANLTKHQVEDSSDIVLIQRPEDNLLINPVDELRPEMASKLGRNLRFRRFGRLGQESRVLSL